MSASQDILLYWPTAVVEIQGRCNTASNFTYVLFIALIVILEVLTSGLQLQVLSRLYLLVSLSSSFMVLYAVAVILSPPSRLLQNPFGGDVA